MLLIMNNLAKSSQQLSVDYQQIKEAALLRQPPVVTGILFQHPRSPLQQGFCRD